MLQRYSISFLGYGLTYLTNLICIPLIIYLSSASNYGEYIIFIGYLGILTAIAPLGLGFKSKRNMPGALSAKYRGEIFYPQFYLNILFAIILGFLFSIFLPIIESYFFESNININSSLIIAYSVVYTIYSQIGFILKFSERIISYNILGFLNPMFFLLGVIAIYYLEDSISIKSLVLAQIFSCLLNIIIFSYQCYKIVGFRIITYTKEEIRLDLRLGLPLLLVVVIEILITSSDRFVISAFMLSQEVAYYTVAYTVASLILIIPKLLSISLEPRLMSLVDKKDDDEIKVNMTFAINLFLLIGLPMIAGAFLYGELAISIFINSDFATHSYLALNVLIVGMFFYGLSILMICLMMAFIKTKNILFINACAAFLNLTLNIIIFNFYQDIIVAAYTSMISYMLMTLFLNFSISKFHKLNIVNKEFYKIFVSSAMSYGMLKCLLTFSIQNNIYALIINVIIFIIIYVLCLILFKSFTTRTIYNSLRIYFNLKETWK